MKLKELIIIEDENLKVVFPLTGASMDITSLTSDSRDVKPNGLFAALRGTDPQGGGLNGADYIEAALKAGATVILCHPDDKGTDHKIAWMLSENTPFDLR